MADRNNEERKEFWDILLIVQSIGRIYGKEYPILYIFRFYFNSFVVGLLGGLRYHR